MLVSSLQLTEIFTASKFQTENKDLGRLFAPTIIHRVKKTQTNKQNLTEFKKLLNWIVSLNFQDLFKTEDI